MNASAESEGQDDDDFFAAMGFEGERVDTAQPTYASDEELLAALGMSRDDVDMPSVRTPAETGRHEPTNDDRFNAVLGMIDAVEAQPAYQSDEELLAALGLEDGAADDTVIAEMPDWATAQDEPEAEVEDFGAMLGMVEEEPAQPAYQSDEELLAALGLEDGAADDTVIAEMPDWATAQDEPEAEVEDFGSMFDEVEAELARVATEPDEVEDELPPPDVTIEVKRTRPATDELPEWARLHYTQDEEEDLFGALKVTTRLPELPADDEPPAEPPDVADQPVEAEAEAADYDAIFGGMDAQQDTGAPPSEDLFAQWATETEMPPTEDFYSALGMIEPEPAAHEQAAAEPTYEEPDSLAWAQVEAPPEEDFFAALGM
ncbi:MAG: hypothetical protein LC121_17885, partial [Anaerolineae bacterium]|nr:hypothetical protein [Anaerolineae bacterium]